MKLRKECEHGLFDPHPALSKRDTRLHDPQGCPGGEFLPEGEELVERIANAMWVAPFDGEVDGAYVHRVARAVLDALASQVGESE